MRKLVQQNFSLSKEDFLQHVFLTTTSQSRAKKTRSLDDLHAQNNQAAQLLDLYDVRVIL